MGEQYTVVIQKKNGPRRVETFAQPEVTIGRVPGNDVVLPEGNISKRHSRVVLKDGRFIIVDLRSTNGTYVNGKRITAPQVLKLTDKVYIGDFTLVLEHEAKEESLDVPSEESAELLPSSEDSIGPEFDDPISDIPELTPPPQEAPPPPPPAAKKEPAPKKEPEPREPPPEATPTPPATKRPPKKKPPKAAPAAPQFNVNLPGHEVLTARSAVYTAVLQAIQKGEDILPANDENTRQTVEVTADKTISAVAHKTADVDTGDWAKQIVEEICSLGPIGSLIDDVTVSEIYVNGPQQILTRTSQGLKAADAFFSSDDALALVVRRLFKETNVLFDTDNPIAEARLRDGTRINAVHQSVAVNGPLVTITRSSIRDADLDELVANEVLSEPMSQLLQTCVRTGQNVLVCGGSGAGMGTMVGALGALISPNDRIVTVQQVANLKLPQPHVVTLESRPTNKGCIADMRGLIANALRMRPDRLVVNQIAGPEALDLMIAMGGGQSGSLVSTYANSARDALGRLETMMQLAGNEMPGRALREQIANSVDIVVELTRFADGETRVTRIVEVIATELDLITTTDIFEYQRTQDAGEFSATGSVPRFYEALKRRGEVLDMGIFR